MITAHDWIVIVCSLSAYLHFLFLSIIFCIPTVIAYFRSHKHFNWVMALNLSVLGWIPALIWALGVKNE